MKKQISNIQYITQDSELFSHAEQALAMFKKGIPWVQLRMKNSTRDEIIAEAKTIKAYADEYQGKLLLNDSVEIALEVEAHAVHLGLNDMPIDEARKLLGNEIIIGGTANTMEDVLLQASRGADYVGLGPFRYTSTKKNLSPVIGLQGYEYITAKLAKHDCDTPIIAVGGITLADIPAIKATGIYGVAISGDLLKDLKKD
jgi:thiamine-phosphate pyrophosphorylase